MAAKKASRKKSTSKTRKSTARKSAVKSKKKSTAKKASARKAATRKATRRKKAATGRAASRKKPAGKKAKKKTAGKKKVSKRRAAATKKGGKKKAAAKKKPAARKSVSRKAAAKKTAKKPGRKKTSSRKGSVKKAPVATTKSRRKPAAKSAPRSAARSITIGDTLIHGISPYQPKAGEEYMSDAQLEHFRQILLAWKRELMEEVDRTVHHMQDEASNFPDPNDRATQESEFGLELRTRDRERKLLKKIESALSRIEDGSYGFCEETGEEIGLKRLEARPVATLSVEAQERRELAERQYRDRDDQYR